MLIAFIILSKKLPKLIKHDKVEIDNKKVWEDRESKFGWWNSDLQLNSLEKNLNDFYPVLVFFCFFIVISVIIITSIVSDEGKFSWWLVLMLIIPVILFIFGVWGTVYALRHRYYDKKLYEHIKNWTILEKKAIITKFKYFREMNIRHNIGKEWYVIIANIWEQTFKSDKISVLILWAEWRDIDKKFYEEKGIPYSPSDPKFNADYKRREEYRIKEIDAQLAWLSGEFESASWFRKNKIQKEINELVVKKALTSPKALPYKGKSYYIGDEIIVLVDPDNPKNYIM